LKPAELLIGIESPLPPETSTTGLLGRKVVFFLQDSDKEPCRVGVELFDYIVSDAQKLRSAAMTLEQHKNMAAGGTSLRAFREYLISMEAQTLGRQAAQRFPHPFLPEHGMI
jgi:hypothetical protein